MKHRRQAQSSALSFIDCICCGFGAVLLLFILTAKSQIDQKETDAEQALAAFETLQQAIAVAEEKQRSVDEELAALNPQPDPAEGIEINQLNAELKRLSTAIEEKKAALAFLNKETESSEAVAALERPSADKSYLSGLRLQGPRVLILLENSGSMLAEDARSALEMIRSGNSSQSGKWLRAKASVCAVLAAIPRGTKVAVFQMNQTASPLFGTLEEPYLDPYENSELIRLLDRLETLDASGGANLLNAFTAIKNLGEPPSSLLLISDGLPTAPNPTNGSLSEKDRIRLFNLAMSARPNFPVNTILFPFEGDPSAAALFWKLGSLTSGITLVPDNDWPAL
jgi:hypothetical protein